MKNAIRFAMVTLAAVGPLSCGKGSNGTGTTSPTEVRLSMSGIVTDVVSGAPIAGVAVALQGTTATTGSDGRYSLTGLTAVAGTLTAKHQGYDNFSQSVTVSGQTTTNVPLTPAAAAQAAGSWRDSGSGGTTMEVTVDTIAETMTLVVDYKGSKDSPPETYRGSYSPTTGVNATQMSPVVGNISLRLIDGKLTGTITNVPDPDISRTEFTGTGTPTEVVVTATHFLKGGGQPIVETLRARK